VTERQVGRPAPRRPPDGGTNLGDRVRAARRAMGLSAEEVAARCRAAGVLTMSRGTLAKIESGVRGNVTVDEAIGLASALGMSLTDLVQPPRGNDDQLSDTRRLLRGILTAIARREDPSAAELDLIADIIDADEASPAILKREFAKTISEELSELPETLRETVLVGLGILPRSTPQQEPDSMTGRLQSLSHSRHRSLRTSQRYYNTGTATLVERLEGRLRVNLERRAQAIPEPYQGIYMDRLVSTTILCGRTPTERITERWVRATRDGVDSFVVRAHSDEHSEVLIEPHLNCRQVETRTVRRIDGQAVVLGTFAFARPLELGESYFFSTRVLYKNAKTESFYSSVQVTTEGIAELVMRVQFDPADIPRTCWFNDHGVDVDALVEPDPGSPKLVEVSSLGFVEVRSEFCRPGDRFSLAWTWK
jgi:transcriptional regulator with XRE-family HTH domain